MRRAGRSKRGGENEHTIWRVLEVNQNTELRLKVHAPMIGDNTLIIIDKKTLAESADEEVMKLRRIIDNNAVVYPYNDIEQR